MTSSETRRWWRIRGGTPGNGEDQWLTLTSRDGFVGLVASGPVQMDPEAASKLRTALGEALTQAMWDRDGW